MRYCGGKSRGHASFACGVGRGQAPHTARSCPPPCVSAQRHLDKHPRWQMRPTSPAVHPRYGVSLAEPLLRRHLESVCGPSRVAKGLAARVAWYCVHHDTVKKLWVTLCICIAFRLPVRTWEHATAATRAALSMILDSAQWDSGRQTPCGPHTSPPRSPPVRSARAGKANHECPQNTTKLLQMGLICGNMSMHLACGVALVP